MGIFGAPSPEPWHGFQHGAGIGMRRRFEELFARRCLDEAAEIKHRHAMAEKTDGAEVVGNEKIGRAQFTLQPPQEVDDFGARRRIQRRRRFVQHDQLRPGDDGVGPILAVRAMKGLGLALSAMLLAGAAIAEPAVVASGAYPEGLLWHGGRMYFTEMGADRVSIIADGAMLVEDDRIQAVGPRAEIEPAIPPDAPARSGDRSR